MTKKTAKPPPPTSPIKPNAKRYPRAALLASDGREIYVIHDDHLPGPVARLRVWLDGGVMDVELVRDEAGLKIRGVEAVLGVPSLSVEPEVSNTIRVKLRYGTNK